jgi:hypothetical protein
VRQAKTEVFFKVFALVAVLFGSVSAAAGKREDRIAAAAQVATGCIAREIAGLDDRRSPAADIANAAMAMCNKELAELRQARLKGWGWAYHANLNAQWDQQDMRETLAMVLRFRREAQ